MKEYFRNILIALRGKNPYGKELWQMNIDLMQAQVDLAQAKIELEATTEHVKDLCKKYNDCCESTSKLRGQVLSLQQLVENLKERIAEKDAIINKIKGL